MEKRFGFHEIPETAQVQLNNMKQYADESIKDWADRVLQLATKAFPELPDNNMYKQAINRICHGSYDREAGQYAVNLHLRTIEETIDKIKSYQFNHQAIYDRSKKEVREVRYEYDSDESDTGSGQPVQIRQVANDRESRSRSRPNFEHNKDKGQGQLDTRLSTIEGQMGSLRSELNTMFKKFEEWRTRSKSPSPRPFRTRSRSATPSDECFNCGGSGHFRRDCPKLKQQNKSAPRVHFEDQSNQLGSRQEA